MPTLMPKARTLGPDAEAIRFLIDERDILGFGTETIGTDCGQAGHLTPSYPAQNFLHGAGKYGLQRLTGLEALPPTSAMIIAAALKILAGSGSPLPDLALVSEAPRSLPFAIEEREMPQARGLCCRCVMGNRPLKQRGAN